MNLIDRYVDLLKQYNEHTNVYSKKAYDKLDFHIQDCITLAELIGNKSINIADFGSGSGLPAIILGITNPSCTIYAIESKSRKTRFLNHVVKELTLSNVNIVTANAYEWARYFSEQIDIITAKAFASVDKIKTISKPLITHKNSQLFVPISAQQALLYDSSNITEKNGFIYYTETL